MEHLDRLVEEFAEIACFALQLLAKLCSVTDRHEMADEANRRALKLNPFLWTPFASLCNRGQKTVPSEIYKFDNIDTFQTCQENINWNSSFIFLGGESMDGSISDTDDLNKSHSIYTTPVMDQNAINANAIENRLMNRSLNTSCTTTIGNLTAYDNLNDSISVGVTPFRRQFRYLSNISPTTPSFGWLPVSSPVENNTRSDKMMSPTLQQQQMRTESIEQSKNNRKNLRSNAITNSPNRKEAPLQISKQTTQTGNTTPRTQNPHGGQNVRRSSRFLNSNSVKENSKNPIGNKFTAPRSPPRKSKQRLTSKMNLSNSALNEINTEKPQKQISDLDKEKNETTTTSTGTTMNAKTMNTSQNVAKQILTLRKQSADGLMSLMRMLAEAYVHLSRFNCREAIESFTSIPNHHVTSSWVQCMIAKAHHERQEYDAAAKLFMDVHRREPHRIQMMEIYSTVLWHMQRDVQLSALAQDLKAQDHMSPITWCVLGNCFSLQKEHESAIKCFERAVQVDPEFTYSYTLLGHELIITEELDKAMSCFRTAILKDPRHYNAWYGIASIYSKQERFSLAEFHFKQALKINQNCSVILVHIGVMQFNLNKIDEALQTMNEAIALDPKNPLSKFHRGSMYFQCGRYNDALRELEQLRHVVPKESVVFYIIGKIHKKLGSVDLALMNFSWATDLDPKGANNQVKDAFDPNPSLANMPLNVTQDAHEAAERSEEESIQLRGGEDGDAEQSSPISDSF